MKQIKEGYKMTELGEIPQEWEVNNLSNIAEICYGKNQKSVEVNDGKYNILGTGGIIGKTNNFLWDKPSVLIGRKGTIDKPQYIDVPFWTVDTLFYTRLNDGFIPKWLYYYLNLIDLKKYNEATGVPSLNTSSLNNIKIVCPPLQEQKKIASILSSVDEQIEINDNLIEKTKELKKGLMQRLLTQGVGHDKFKDTEIGRIPEVWEVKRLGDIGITYSGLSGKTKDDFGKGKSYIPYKNIFANSKIDKNNFEYVDLAKSEKQNTVIYGDILFTTSSETPEEVGMTSVLLDRIKEPLYLNSFCFGYRLNSFDLIKPEFARYMLRGEYLRKKMSILAQGSTRFNLSKNAVMNLIIPVPSKEEQQKIASILSSVDTQIENYQAKKEKLQELKKGLMQQLLTGKLRVKIEN